MRVFPHLAAFVCAFLLILDMGYVPRVALAAPDKPVAEIQRGEEILAKVRKRLSDADYDAVIAESNAALKEHTGNTSTLNAQQFNRLLEAKATAELALGRKRRARATLKELYTRDPGHVLDESLASPAIQSAFGKARDAKRKPLKVTLSDVTTNPAKVQGSSAAATVEVRISEGEGAVAGIRLFYRLTGSDADNELVMKSKDGVVYRAFVPLLGVDRETATTELQYYAQARAPSGYVLRTLNSSQEPKTLVVEWTRPFVGSDATKTGITTPNVDKGRPWLWLGIGVAVVAVIGLAIAGYFIFRPQKPQGTLGSVDLPLR